jgi:type I restriction enzyme, S subunit
MTRGFPRQGDVLFTTEAPVGNAALIRSDERIGLAQRTINLAPYAEFSGAFLELVLLSPWFSAELARRATGMTATGIKAAKLRLIRVPVPPAREQRRIVSEVTRQLAGCMELSHALEQRLDASKRLLSATGAWLG